MEVGQAFDSGEPARVVWAMAQVAEQPAAHSPFMLRSVLAEGLARRGDHAAAARWQLFAEFRANADLVLLAEDESRLGQVMYGGLMAEFVGRRPEGIGPYLEALSIEERAALIRDIARLDAETPRLYAIDWFSMPELGLNNDWRAAPAAWPADSNNKLVEIRTQLIDTFTNRLSASLSD
jgi:hypothetical protein